MNKASILTVLVISLFSCGQKADVYTLHSGDITLTVTNYGARVMSLRTPYKNGVLENIVVGHKTVEEYLMQIKASHYIPINAESIPTGEIAPVDGTPFDFRESS